MLQKPQTEQGLYYRSVQTPTRKIMSPEDVSALEAILSLIREVLIVQFSLFFHFYDSLIEDFQFLLSS
jgi:hypothetical protein